MNRLLDFLEGDKAMWAAVSLLALASFLPVYSSSSNLVYIVGKGTTFGYLLRHAILLFIGFMIIAAIHRVPYNYFSGISLMAVPIVVVLLLFTLLQGTTIGGANASRWIRVPWVGVSFQTSSLALIILPIYVARYLAKNTGKKVSFKSSFYQLWMPVFIICGLILPANLSTAVILFLIVLTLCFISDYPMTDIFKIIGVSILTLLFVMLLSRAFPEVLPTRAATWMSRIENYFSDNSLDANTSYQVLRAKAAIANGGFIGVGSGKSVMKNFLPNSSSDFIYAIILEEYGMLGGGLLILMYLFLLFRMLIAINRSEGVFAKLLICSSAFYILFNALVNMAVAVNIIPVTGQNLPLITSGGSSIWTTCLAIGIVLSVSRGNAIRKSKMEENKISNSKEILSVQV